MSGWAYLIGRAETLESQWLLCYQLRQSSECLCCSGRGVPLLRRLCGCAGQIRSCIYRNMVYLWLLIAHVFPTCPLHPQCPGEIIVLYNVIFSRCRNVGSGILWMPSATIQCRRGKKNMTLMVIHEVRSPAKCFFFLQNLQFRNRKFTKE